MNIDSIILYETERVEDLYPFSIMHCAWEVRCGIYRAFEKIQKCFKNSRIIYKARENHLIFFLARFAHDEQEIKPENLLLLKSSILFSQQLFDRIDNSRKLNKMISEHSREPIIFSTDNKPFAIYLPREYNLKLESLDKIFFEDVIRVFDNLFPKIEFSDVNEVYYLWDAIELNDKEIINDFSYFKSRTKKKYRIKNVSLIKNKNIYIGNDCIIAPNVVIDASEGPVIIDENVNIMPNSTILGPCYIGQNSLIRTGAKIYGKTTIGEVSKIGGDVENSIIHAYSNKQHDGYLGHSYICEWVNLGADTNTSDLKNTYGEIKVNLEDREINTHRIFLGLLCGDHTKAGINTMFTTGTVAGIAGILVNEWFLPNSIPSFSWGGGKKAPIYKVSKAIEIAKIVMARRNKILLPEEELLFQNEHYKLSSKLR